jgi:hypothetical protein
MPMFPVGGSETPFFKTAMGRDFFDRNVPQLVKELKRLNDNLEKMIKQSEPTIRNEEPPHGIVK